MKKYAPENNQGSSLGTLPKLSPQNFAPKISIGSNYLVAIGIYLCPRATILKLLVKRTGIEHNVQIFALGRVLEQLIQDPNKIHRSQDLKKMRESKKVQNHGFFKLPGV